MKYIFCGYMFMDAEEDIKKMRVPPTVSEHKYMSNLVYGLLQNGQDVIVLNTPRLRFFPHYPSVFIRGGNFVLDGKKLGVNAGFINLPLINYIMRTWSIKRILYRMIRKLRSEELTIICYGIFYPIVSSMVCAQRKFNNVNLCAVIGDLSGNNATKNTLRGIKSIIVQHIGKRADYLATKFDAYGFLTKYMPTAMGVDSKPFVVIEGMYSENSEPMETSVDTEEKRIFYAGAIRKEYGLIHLLKAFSLIKNNEYKLILAGGQNGDAVEDVKAYAKRDRRIIYLGYITPSEVEKNQQSATVLVNPRTSEHSFVKYSFPSKSMECLASGKPYIAHDLICNPSEYRNYIQIPEAESDEALAQKIMEICELSLEEREAIGKRSREFILREKNPQKQCKKIVDMMSRIRKK